MPTSTYAQPALNLFPDPPSNTGSDSRFGSYGLGIDWLTLIFRYPTLAQFRSDFDFLSAMLCDSIPWGAEDKPIKRGRWFDHSARSAMGLSLAWSETPHGYVEILLSMPGSALGGSQLELARAISYVRPYVHSVSRLDCYCDDYSRALADLRPLMVAARNDGNATGFQKIEWRISSPCAGFEETTLYLGSRESCHFYRIYDKDERSRMEVELHDHKALQAFSLWLDAFGCRGSAGFGDGTMQSAFTSIVFSHIDFIDKKDKNLNRNERLPWWQAFLDLVGACRIRFNRDLPTATIEGTKTWIQRQVETSLCMLRSAMGYAEYHNWMSLIMESGEARLSRIHASLISNYRQVTEFARTRFYNGCPLPIF